MADSTGDSRVRRILDPLVAFLAVVTLPVGVLAGLFVGVETAVAAFVVGWLLLVPVTEIAGTAVLGAVLDEGDAPRADADPLETLRDRYARGELGDEEFEARVERLLETEDADVADDAPPDSGESGRIRDPEREPA